MQAEKRLMFDYARTVIGYHGCDHATAEEIFAGRTKFKPSVNDYDWLGTGVYFWEYGVDRARRFAEQQSKRPKGARVKKPAVVGAVIHLGACFDLLDTRFTSNLGDAFAIYKDIVAREGWPVLKNEGKAPDHKLRRLDCAVVNWYLSEVERDGKKYDTVRGGFVEGGPAFEGSNIQRETHIQIAVRNPRCILGVFRPTIENGVQP